MRIHQITMDSANAKYAVILKDASGVHKLSLPLGTIEAKMLTFVLSNKSLPFPLLHDTMIGALSICGGTLKSVTIDDFKNNAFISHILIEHTTKQICFACKPTDGILIALKNKMPIRVSEHIINDFSNQAMLHNIKPDDISSDVQHSPINSISNKTFSQMIRGLKPSIEIINKSHNQEDNDTMLELLLKLNPETTRKM